MRYFIIFILFFALNTEGVCQAYPDYRDSLNYESEDVIEDNENYDDDIYVNPQQEALEKYYQEDISQHEFDKSAWEKATNGLDYTIEDEKKKEQQNPKKRAKATPPPTINPAFVELLKWFFIIAAGVLLAYLIYRFVDGGNIFSKESRRINSSVGIDMEKLEENLTESDDLEPFIQKAIAKKEYALAVRLYYLAILKELTLKNHIEWKKDKTNRTYVREMRPNRLFEPFRETTTIFERTWYGDKELNEPYFLSIQPVFRDMLNQAKG